MGAGDDLKNDFKNMFKHSKRMIRGFFRGRGGGDCDCDNQRRRPCQGPRPSGFFPFFSFRSPLTILFYPKIVVAILILIALLFCGVGLYGLIVIVLLILLFILI